MIEIKNKELEKNILFQTRKTKETLVLDDILSIKDINLNSVTLKNTLQPIYFDDLQYFRNLERLSISNTNITNEDMGYIFSLSNLKSLSFYECTFNYLNGIERLNNLENLYLSKVSFSNIESINKVSSLIGLNLIGLEFDSLEWLVPLSNLKFLDISYSNINNCDGISRLSSLESFYAYDVHNLNIDEILLLPNLKEVKIANDDISSYLDKFNSKGIKVRSEHHIVGDGEDV